MVPSKAVDACCKPLHGKTAAFGKAKKRAAPRYPKSQKKGRHALLVAQ